jgi:Peptidase family M49
MRSIVGISLLLIVLAMPLFAAQKKSRKKQQPKPDPVPKACVTCDMKVAPDLSERLTKWKPVVMPFHPEVLTPNEVKVVQKLVQATRMLENIFWRQSDPEGLSLYQQLNGSAHKQDQQVRRLLFINGSRYDLLDENKPFVGDEPYRPGRGFYPADLTRDEVEKYVKEHPDQKQAIYSPFTVVRLQGDKLQTVPYSVAYKSFLEPAAKALQEAADLTDDKDFANFLRLRAKALLNDDYYESDLAWMELKNPRIDVIMAPYETYLDDLLGVKASYGPAVLIRNEEESKKLEVYQKYVADLQDALPLAPEDRPSKKGHLSPMEVMDAPYRGGDLRHGYQAVADNLPNDRRIHEQKGSKKIFFKNFMDVRVNYIILPVAKLLMDPKQAAKASGDGNMAATLMHEICHGLGPVFARVNDQQLPINEAIGPIYGALEEAKADVVGLWALRWLVDKGVLPKARLEEYYASALAGTFRTLRFGIGESHGQAEMMEFNYYFERGAVKQDASGRYAVDYEKIGDSVASLAKELLEIEATGDRARAEAWFAKYDKMPDHLKSALKKTTSVPVDVDPRFSFPDRVE